MNPSDSSTGPWRSKMDSGTKSFQFLYNIKQSVVESRQIYSPSDDQLERACPPKNHNVETLPNKYSRYISSSSWKILSRPWILPAVDTTWRPLEDLCTRDKHFNFSRASSNYVTLEQPKPQQCCSLASALSESQVTTRKHQHSQYLPATRVNHNRQFDARPRGLVVIHGDEEILPESHMNTLTAFSLKELKRDYWLVVVQNLRS